MLTIALSDRCQVAKSWRRTERDRFGVVHRINQSDFDDEQPLTSGGWKNFCALFRGGDEMGQPLQGRSSSRCCCLALLFHFYSISISFLLYILLIGLDYFHCRERLDSASKLKKGHQMWLLCFSALKTLENSLTEGCCCFFRGPQDVAEVEVSLQKEWCFSHCFSIKLFLSILEFCTQLVWIPQPTKPSWNHGIELVSFLVLKNHTVPYHKKDRNGEAVRSSATLRGGANKPQLCSSATTQSTTRSVCTEDPVWLLYDHQTQMQQIYFAKNGSTGQFAFQRIWVQPWFTLLPYVPFIPFLWQDARTDSQCSVEKWDTAGTAGPLLVVHWTFTDKECIQCIYILYYITILSIIWYNLFINCNSLEGHVQSSPRAILWAKWCFMDRRSNCSGVLHVLSMFWCISIPPSLVASLRQVQNRPQRGEAKVAELHRDHEAIGRGRSLKWLSVSNHFAKDIGSTGRSCREVQFLEQVGWMVAMKTCVCVWLLHEMAVGTLMQSSYQLCGRFLLRSRDRGRLGSIPTPFWDIFWSSTRNTTPLKRFRCCTPCRWNSRSCVCSCLPGDPCGLFLGLSWPTDSAV